MGCNKFCHDFSVNKNYIPNLLTQIILQKVRYPKATFNWTIRNRAKSLNVTIIKIIDKRYFIKIY